MSNSIEFIDSGGVRKAVKGNSATGAVYVEQLTSGGQSNSSYGYKNTITWPENTTAYTAGDVIGDTNGSAIFEIPNVGVAGTVVRLLTANLIFAVTSVPAGMTTFQMWLFNASPTSHADKDALALQAADTTKYVDDFTLTTPVDKGPFLASINRGVDIDIQLVSTSLYFMLQTTAGFTPSSAAVKYMYTDFIAL
jgi:hypothetical protein